MVHSFLSFSRYPTQLDKYLDSGRAEHGLHELIVVDLDPAVAIGVEPLEGLGEGLDDDTGANEAVERDAGWSGTRHGRRGGLFNV